MNKAKKTLKKIGSNDVKVLGKVLEIETYIEDVERQIDQIIRRVVNGESIPHHEKVFSIFERHTEWISKGKAGVPVELGLNVCIVKDQFGFILHHHVMQQETDDKIAVSMVEETQNKFNDFTSCSFDKGFHSKTNQKKLSELLDFVVKKANLPKSERNLSLLKRLLRLEKNILGSKFTGRYQQNFLFSQSLN